MKKPISLLAVAAVTAAALHAQAQSDTTAGSQPGFFRPQPDPSLTAPRTQAAPATTSAPATPAPVTPAPLPPSPVIVPPVTPPSPVTVAPAVTPHPVTPAPAASIAGTLADPASAMTANPAGTAPANPAGTLSTNPAGNAPGMSTAPAAPAPRTSGIAPRVSATIDAAETLRVVEEQADRSEREADRARQVNVGPAPVNGAFTGLTSDRDR